ncbi:MAG: hypothetical protein JWN76_1006 [Chitinophagaceae bacterium]|nr:hypothetical protein [Chitinophagaceae bacterium]
MVLTGCKPSGRHTEQHDIFFGVANKLSELVPGIIASWPETNKIHVDAWREVTAIDQYSVKVVPKMNGGEKTSGLKLFFINLGGYKRNEFEEYHYKIIVAAKDLAGAIHQSKQTAFYKHTGFENAHSHVDDKYGIDVDDAYEIEDLLPLAMKEKFTIEVSEHASTPDTIHLGYFKMTNILENF